MNSILNNRISNKRRQKFRNTYCNSSTAIFSFTMGKKWRIWKRIVFAR